jgi:hypothetical protein
MILVLGNTLESNIPVLTRLWKHSSVKGNHWIWTGAIDDGGNKPYGKITINRKTYIVSRLSLCIFLKLKYNDSWLACHNDSLCGYTLCWNPLHLYVGDKSTNTYDSIKKGTHYKSLKFK